MSFWSTLKALLVHDAVKSMQEKPKARTLHDFIAEQEADERTAEKQYVPQYQELENSINVCFRYLIEITTPGMDDLHKQYNHYTKLLNGMPMMIALDHDYELTGCDGVHMYKGMETIFRNKYASVTSFSGSELRLAFQEHRNLYHEFVDQVGLDTLGVLWYKMMFLIPKDGKTDVRKVISDLFGCVCAATVTIAKMSGENYKYSVIPDTVTDLTFQFEAMMELSQTDDFVDKYFKFNEELGEMDYSDYMFDVSELSYPRIMEYREKHKYKSEYDD